MSTNPMMMLRLFKMLQGNQQGMVAGPDPSARIPSVEFNSDVVNPHTEGPAEDNIWALPAPRNVGAMPQEGLRPEEMPQGAPGAVDPELQRIRNLYEQEAPDVEKYRNYLADAPQRENYKPSKLRTILSSLLAGGASFAGVDDQSAMNLGVNVRDNKYNNAKQDYDVRGKGLRELATLGATRQNRKVLGEEAVQREITKRDQDKANNQARLDTLKLRGRELDEKMRKENLDDATKKQLAKERNDVMLEIAKIRAESQEDRGAAQADRANKKISSWYDPDNNQNVAVSAEEAKAKGFTNKLGDKEINRENFLRRAETDLDTALKYFEKHPEKTGQIQGRLTEGKRALDMLDPEALSAINILESYTGDSLREKGGAHLSQNEIKVYDPINPKLIKADKHLIANLKEAIRRTKEMKRKKAVAASDDEFVIEDAQ